MFDFSLFKNLNLHESSDFISALSEIAEFKTFPKNHIIHASGSICSHFYIITKGIARVFYFKEEKDITVHFAAEHDSITAIDSLIQRKKSKYSIETIEETETFAVNINSLELLFEKEPQFERFGRLFLQDLYIDLVERIDDLQLHTAQERYDTLLSKKPYLFQRVPSKHLASFLGMTAETLSRIKGK